MQPQRTDVMGWGVDRRLEDRPGVPMEQSPPRPVGNPSWQVPEQQHTERAPLVAATRSLTPVYSTALPPRGLSGVLRRAAYRIPDYRARRWLLLMFADRVDVVEHNPRAAAKFLGGIGAVALAVMAIRALRRA
ncbi:MAG TPA: hypothetical protein VKY73_18715 [Polyangiaceae bacterium]|nr:hypothetical protein [Polyangiaceae bacterium]